MDTPWWLIFALASPFFWAIVHVLDAYCVEELFDRSWVGIFTSALAMLVVLPMLALGLFIRGVSAMSVEMVALCSLSGVVFMTSQILYFKALESTESGIVAAYWNIIPIILPILSYLLWGEVLSKSTYVGIGILIFSSVLFCLLDDNHEARWSSIALMFLAAWMQVLYFIIQKHIFDQCEVYQGFLVITFAMAITGITPILFKVQRKIIRANMERIWPMFWLILLVEVANLIAIATSQFAVNLAAPSLVSAVEASTPAYTFVISFSLFAMTKKYGEANAKRALLPKILLVSTMVLGVWLVS